jgi:serine/threonine-protein kinase
MVIGGPAARRSSGATAHDPPTGEMTVKLTDFGIARAAEQTRLTQVGSVVGTAAYLAPEQARGEEATPASDVYALGVVIYQLLTGRLPWEGATLAELALRRESERPLPPSSYDPAVPETLSTAVLRSLDGDPAGRYSTARQLAVALRAGGAGHQPPPPDSAVTDATRMMPGGTTAATRHLPAEPAPPPRPAPARTAPRPRPAAKPAGRAPRRSLASRVRSAIGVLLVIAILAAVVAGVVLLTTNAGQNTDLVKDTIPDQVDKLKDVINSVTQ